MPKQPDNHDPLRAVLAGQPTEYERKTYARLKREQLRRECEALRVYEPLPYQDEFHRCKNQQALIQKGNRVGGTLALMVEIARAVTGQDPHGKYPLRDGRAVLLGYGEKHIGRVFYDKLFRPGAFRIIRDLQTGHWRVYRPWQDAERFKESKPVPPLIPRRFIEGKIAWEKRSEHVFSLVRLTTGWELHATNSAGDPGQAQGFSVNVYGIDEDLATGGWYEEAIGRVADCGGLIRWSALPHARNDDLMQLIDLAEKEAAKPKPTAVIIRASIYDNTYLPKDSVEQSVTAWKAQGEEIYRKRAMGEIAIDSILMYPTFSRRLHDVMQSSTLAEDQQTIQDNGGAIPGGWTAQRILAARMGEPPEDWTRYVTIDPGYNVCAIEFITVPPPELGNQLFLYDECYLKEATAWHFGEAMEFRCRTHTFEAFYFDMHGGRLRSIATGVLPVDKYSEELEKRAVRCERTGHGFRHGCDDIKRREEEMRTALAVQRDGYPRLMVVAGKCPSFCFEMERFKKVLVRQWGKEVPTDKGDRRVNTHAIEAVEQAIATDLSYVKPGRKHQANTWIDQFLKWRENRRTERRESQLALGSQSISLGPIGANV